MPAAIAWDTWRPPAHKQAEVAAIGHILAATFRLGPLQAAKLRAACTDLELHAADPDEFARAAALGGAG